MSGFEKNYEDVPMQAMVGASALNRAMRQRTYSERVTDSIAQAEEQLADLKRIQEIFTKHPEFEELLTLVQRGRL